MASDSVSAWRGAWVTALLACIVLGGIALRLHHLDAHDLTEDEELATGLSQLGFADLFTEIAGRPPLSFLTQKAAIDLLGNTSPFTLRLPRVLEGSAAIVLIFLLMRAVAGSRSGLIAAALLALNHFHFEWSRDARYYPMLALMSLLGLYGYWQGGVKGKPSGVAWLVVGSSGAALTHYSGYLFCAAMVCAMPGLILTSPWRERVLARPKAAAGVAAGAVLAGLSATVLLGDYLGRVTKHLKWPDFSQPLPPLFDVSPRFLLNRFDEYLGIPDAWRWAALLLCVVGLIHGARRSIHWAVVSLAVLVIPFALYFIFPPAHPWHPKYFIFMTPVLLANAALGIEALVFVTTRPIQQAKLVRAVLAAAVVVLLVTPYAWSNGERISRAYAHPDQAQQQLGADLGQWFGEGDRFHYTWPERARVLRHYFPKADDPARERLLRADVPFPALYSNSGVTWFSLDGKSDTDSLIAAELLSARYTRTAYDEVFLARAPSLQHAAYGVGLPGSPMPEGPYLLAPGDQTALELLCPRAFDGCLLIEAVPAEGEVRGQLRVSLDDASQWPVRLNPKYPVKVVEVIALKRGPLRIRVENTGKTNTTLNAVSFVPYLADKAISIPAWDFLSLTGSDVLASVWPDETPEGMLLRDMRHGQAATYRFYNEKRRRVLVRVHALNDAPYSNRYQVLVPGTQMKYRVLEFAAESNEITSLDTEAFELPPGVRTLSIGYIGLSADDFNEATRGGRVATEESLQNPGLLRVEIVPVEAS